MSHQEKRVRVRGKVGKYLPLRLEPTGKEFLVLARQPRNPAEAWQRHAAQEDYEG